ncbi:hypothetical protein ACFL2Q_11105, partial [Thermodesulfobacteriota bacterium]
VRPYLFFLLLIRKSLDVRDSENRLVFNRSRIGVDESGVSTRGWTHGRQRDVYGVTSVGKRLIVPICLVSVACLLVVLLARTIIRRGTQSGRPTIAIQSRVDRGPWLTRQSVYPLAGQTVELKVTKKPGAEIRWYRIIPDLSIRYKNANFPDEENSYAWAGFDEIKYHRKELPHFRNQWKIRLFPLHAPRHPKDSTLVVGKASLSRLPY